MLNRNFVANIYLFMIGFGFKQLSIATAWALQYLRLWSSPANKGKKTFGVRTNNVDETITVLKR